MSAIAGFDLTISGDDVVVGPGMIDEVAVAGGTLDVSVLALGDGDNQIILDEGATVTAIAEATALDAGDVKLGEFTEATAAATAVSFAGRGDQAAVSADV